MEDTCEGFLTEEAWSSMEEVRLKRQGGVKKNRNR